MTPFNYSTDTAETSQPKNNCIDVDECSIENGGCEHYCENSEGSFR